jgi:tetratricopeptide (TPR) repeat protein
VLPSTWASPSTPAAIRTRQIYYREVLAQFPEDSVASCRLASSLYSQSKHAEAMALLQEIIKKSPRAYCAYFTLGVAFADAGIYKDAIRMWRKVVEIAPTSPEAISARESIDVLEKFVAQ